MGIKDYSTTANSNTSISGISIADGMPPRNVNDAQRAVMADTRSAWNTKEFFIVGDGDGPATFTRASTTTVTVGSDITATHHVGRRVKIIGANTSTTGIFGKITGSSYSSPNTTLTFAFDSGNINSADSTVDVYLGSTFIGPSIPVIDEDNMASNSAILPPSQQSVKAYVDAEVTAQDLDFAGASGSGSIDLNSQTFTIASGEGIDTVASGQTLTVSGEDATTSNKGIASFSSDNFAVSSGAVTIKDGGVANAELANNDVNYGGVTLALGASDTTPAFNLSDATSYPTSSLAGTISNAQLATGIDAVKLADGTVTNAELQHINTLSSNAQTQLDAKLVKASNLSDLVSASTARSNLGLGTIATQASSSVSISGGSITGIGSPSSNTDVAIKSYVDQAVAGLRTRTIAECATTGNINLSNALEAGDAIDGVTLVAGDRVLVKNQSTATENGLYLAVGSGAGAASRDPEHDSIAELSGGMVITNQGSVNDNKIFLCTTDTDATLGSTSITYTTITPQNVGTVTSITAGTGLSGGAITGSGTIAIDTATTVDKTTAQTLTNKTLTAPKINENVAVTSTATELNLLDGKAATNLALIGKQEGTSFTGSLLVGHATTGTISGTLLRDTGVGIGALNSLTAGDNNTAVGYNALTAATSGFSNTALGQDALLAVNSGNSNIGIGKAAGDNITSGDGNIMIGNINAPSATGDKQLEIADGVDGSINWISGDSAGTVSANGGHLTTTGKALVMGF